jgi:hypothetical protein
MKFDQDKKLRSQGHKIVVIISSHRIQPHTGRLKEKPKSKKVPERTCSKQKNTELSICTRSSWMIPSLVGKLSNFTSKMRFKTQGAGNYATQGVLQHSQGASQ